ncbi:TetR/AcrR family transcriptional regulator [Actinophytocola sp. NPDC049390]|uniref:TetR/AcrR family transcriptional regulator n=1 Tax=Actinophytocola sp. NPDC049390 TaxID=3363894 RepID=UPI0037980197
MSPRRYEMRARADSSAATRQRIVRATIDLAFELERVDATLDQIARRAETSVQTILRHFGTRDGLMTAAIEHAGADVAEERRDPAGGIDANIARLVSHYERRGRFVLRLLAADDTAGDATGDEAARTVTGPGKLLHRRWVEDVFADELPARGPRHDSLVDMLVVTTDVYAWKLLRLDRGLDVHTTEDRIRTMTRSILNESREGAS